MTNPRSTEVGDEAMRPNERWVGDLSQHEYDRILARLAEADRALMLADGSLTWCQHRHDRCRTGRDEALDEAVFAVTRITRRRGTPNAHERKRPPEDSP